MKSKNLFVASLLAGLTAMAGAEEPARFEMNPKLKDVPDNTWVKMEPDMTPRHKNYRGFNHHKGESFLVYDESANLTVWFGGCSSGYGNCTWVYDGSKDHWREANPGTWVQVEGGRDVPEQLTKSLPPGSCQNAITYSPDMKQCLMFKMGSGSGWEPWRRRTGSKGSIWQYNARENVWKLRESNGPRPSMYIGHQMHYDREGKRALVFGGLGRGSSVCHCLWSYDPQANLWTDLKAANPPPARMQFSSCFDEKNRQFILFGGSASDNGVSMGDTWIYEVEKNAWRKVETAVSPPARSKSAAAYDAANGAMILFGGRHIDAERKRTSLNDTWVFDPSDETWREMKPDPAPGGNKTFQMAYDRVNNATLVVNGRFETWAYRYRAVPAAGEE